MFTLSLSLLFYLSPSSLPLSSSPSLPLPISLPSPFTCDRPPLALFSQTQSVSTTSDGIRARPWAVYAGIVWLWGYEAQVVCLLVV